MKKIKWCLIAVISVMLIFSFSGCGEKFDPVAYVQGNFDLFFHGEASEEFVDSLEDVETVDELKAEYNEIVDFFTDETINSLSMDTVDDNVRNDLHQMYVALLDASKYEITGNYSENNDEYEVEVIAYPLETYNDVINDEDGTLTAKAEEAITADASYDEIMATYIGIMAKEVESALADPTYGEPKTYNIRVFVDEDGYYTVDEDQIADITGFLLGE